MRSPRKNFTKGYQIVKADFQNSVAGLFEKQNITAPNAVTQSSSIPSFAHFATYFKIEKIIKNCTFKALGQ